MCGTGGIKLKHYTVSMRDLTILSIMGYVFDAVDLKNSIRTKIEK